MKTVNYQSDVLIVGGGTAGLPAAIKIRELNQDLDVLVVDKGGIGWAGHCTGTGGHLMIIDPESGEAGVEDWVKSLMKFGEGLCNVPMLYKYARELYDTHMQIFNWGVPYMRDLDGKIHMDSIPQWRVKHKMTGWVTHRVLLPLKKVALGKGVKMLNKIEMVDLLTHDGRVVGATGFDILSGDFCVFKCKAILIAAGSCNFKFRRMFSVSAGELVVAAYNSGCEGLHTEYALQFGNAAKIAEVWHRGAGQQDALVNAKGEYIVSKYFPGIPESHWRAVYAMVKEVQAGNGPIYLDVTREPERYEKRVMDNVSLWTLQQGAFLDPDRILREKAGIDLHSQRVEWFPTLSGHVGNIRIDLDCKNPNLEGLWAAGDTVANSIAMEGAVVPHDYGSIGLPFALWMGLTAAKSIAQVAPKLPEPKINIEQQKSQKERIFAPMTRKKTEFEPYNAITKIQEVIIPAKYAVLKEAGRLKEALSKIEEVKKEVLPKVKAENPHELVQYHQADSMAVCAEMVHRTSLFRTETRGAHIREDYPEKDDKNWLKWTVIKKEGERMVVSAIPVPQFKV